MIDPGHPVGNGSTSGPSHIIFFGGPGTPGTPKPAT